MTEIFLIRHAEAEGNLYRRIHGRYNSLITQRGAEQVKALARRFENQRIDAVYSSDLARAMATAAAVYVPKKLPLETREGLREVALGAWEDLTWGEVETFQKEQYYNFTFSPDKWSIPGGEAWEETKARVFSAMTDIARANDGRRVAVFSHGCAIRAFLSVVLNVPGSEISRIPHYDNTAVSFLRYDGGSFELVYGGDSSHLPDELSAFRRDTWWKEESGTDGRNMRFVPFHAAAEREKYLARYRDAWIKSYGNTVGFTDIYHDWAVMRSIKDENAVVEGVLGDKPAGMIELAPEVGEDEGRGHIAFLCLDEPFRRRGFAVQLIGHAVSYYRALGRDRLSLRVTRANTEAVDFYERCGFAVTAVQTSARGDVLIMEKGIKLP